MKVLSSLQIKSVEKTAVENGLFSYAQLMENAGKAVFSEVVKRYAVAGKKVLIIVGSGNNGGDGLVVASHLKKCGAFVSIFAPLGMPAAVTASIYLDSVKGIPVCDELSDNYNFYIDALFGIGFNRELSPELGSLIDVLNSFSGTKIAIDVPSGVFSDGGMSKTAFKADLTVTFIGYKLCHLLPETSDYCGEVVLKSLNVDVGNNYSYSIIDSPDEKIFNKNSHKGTFGTSLLVCGSYGMCGAEILAARAACTSGSGIVKCVVCDKNYSAFTQAVPEAVTIPVETGLDGTPILYEKTIFSALSSASAMLIGCGLGRTDTAKSLVKKMLTATNIPTVLDADGINAVASDISILRRVKSPLVLTPHPGEMARLMGTDSSEIEKHRVVYAKRFACDNQCVLVLKGANTIIAAPNGEVYFNITGNYGLGKGGSGDVLSGVIVALLANGCDALTAAKTAVYVHGKAGDMAAQRYTKRTMLPSDIITELKHIIF